MIKCDWCEKNILIYQKIEEIDNQKMHTKCTEEYCSMKMQED